MEESSREVERDPGTGRTVLLSLVPIGRDADPADKVSEECGRILSQVERAVWSTGQLLFSELWSTGHLSADIVVGGEDGDHQISFRAAPACSDDALIIYNIEFVTAATKAHVYDLIAPGLNFGD
jgi:hypothetical protein